MVCAFQLLPTNEPRWRESGHVVQSTFGNPQRRGRVTLAYCLQVARGEYVVHVRLPAFPTCALAECLAYRHCEINVRQPVARLELISRGWRRIERLDWLNGRRGEREEVGWRTIAASDQRAAWVTVQSRIA